MARDGRIEERRRISSTFSMDSTPAAQADALSSKIREAAC
jgi:hypothetical protein